MNEIKYKSNHNIVYSCKYHVIWCSKYRRKVLIPKVADRLKEIIYDIAKKSNTEILELTITEDHVHLLIDIDPSYTVMKFIKKVKGTSSKILRKEFLFLRTKLPTLWTNSCLLSTIGGVSSENVKKYIENQQTSERIKQKQKWQKYVKDLQV